MVITDCSSSNKTSESILIAETICCVEQNLKNYTTRNCVKNAVIDTAFPLISCDLMEVASNRQEMDIEHLIF
ncbi:hypothetical protein T01_9690 [Trichinella spiralis]|uniref:Uncharacterized protein n=1 Tax=Trichinella spiralis TaxID=6334 RepID=A0A0V1AIS5_TRISP|nr:hypothetical protein T01_9690 [Trichinella spiralis]